MTSIVVFSIWNNLNFQSEFLVIYLINEML